MKIFCITLIFLFPVTAFAQTDYTTLEKEIFTATNVYRTSKGLVPLKWNDTIYIVALEHSKNMASGKIKPSHAGFEKRNSTLTKKFGRPISMGENIAVNITNAAETVEGWMKSKGHNENLLCDFEYMVIAVAAGKGGVLYVTQLFVK
jgi:uncharacterized protein YkwD